MSSHAYRATKSNNTETTQDQVGPAVVSGVNTLSGANIGLQEAYAGAAESAESFLSAAASEVGIAFDDEPVGTLSLHAIRDVEAFTYDGILHDEDGGVGHSWVEYRALDGSDVRSWGFYPASLFLTAPTDSYVAGELRSPDPHSGDVAATLSVEITAAELAALETYAGGWESRDYSVFFSNCTDFATGAFEAAGQDAPASGALGVNYPNALFEGIEARNARYGLDAFEQPTSKDHP